MGLRPRARFARAWSSAIKEASKELNIIDTNITAICKNKNKTAKSKNDMKKYTFRYLN